MALQLTNQTVTAYCTCHICCGPQANNITASGKPPTQNHTIAGPRRYPLGTIVAIGGNVYVLQDRTAKRYDNRWDIFFADHKAARQFGKQKLEVRILSTVK